MDDRQTRKKLTQTERRYVFDKFSGHCAYCGEKISLENFQVDHVVPLKRGGADSIDNMFPACRSCNHYKSTFSVGDFRREIERWLQRLRRDSVTYRNALRFGLFEEKPRKIIFYFELAWWAQGREKE